MGRIYYGETASHATLLLGLGVQLLALAHAPRYVTCDMPRERAVREGEDWFVALCPNVTQVGTRQEPVGWLDDATSPEYPCAAPRLALRRQTTFPFERVGVRVEMARELV